MTEVIEQIKIKEIEQGKEKRNVPEMRFRGFEDEWEEKKLGSLGSFLKGNGLSKADLSYDGQECILYGELYTKYNEVITNIQSKTNLEDKNFIRSKINDVIIPSSGETAIDIATASCVKKDNVILGGDLNVFRPNDVDGIFVSYQLNNQKRTEIAKIAQGASVVHVYNEQLKKVKICITEIQEQKKIADFFSLVDKKIEKQSEKVEALKTYKKGIMQKIFKQEIRFKDENGGEYPEWEKKKIKEVAHTFIGLVTTMTENYVENGVKLIRNSDIKENRVCVDNLINLDKAFAEQNSSRCLRLNDVVTVHTGDIGTSAVIKEDLIGALGFATINTRPNNDILESNYLAHYFNSYENKKYALRMSTGDGRSNYNLKDFDNAIIKIPCIKEQNKIADFLGTIDKKIEKEEKKLEKLRIVKKGLLQKMFV